MRWVQSAPGDFAGTPPSPRSGHTAVKVGKSLVVVFGGLVDKRFLNDLIVYDIDNKAWFQPNCVGSGNDGEPIGPSPRAFHVAVAIDCNMFIFGGRSGRKRLGDFWMLDTDIWQWAELSSYGDLPPARDFAAGASVGNGKLVLYGGWDGSKWLSDVYVLDTISLEWRQLPVIGPSPAPRCGHTATMVEKRLLIFGGRGGGGPIMGDLWALKGLFDEEKESPAWTQLKLSGQAPAPRCGHTISSGGTQLLVFGGHGTGGWLTRYDIYYNDCVILDRASVQWKRLPLNSEPPPPRAYHSITRVGVRFLLIGGYDGKSTFGDLWWLVSEDDPIAKRALSSTQSHVDVNQPSVEEQSQASTRQIASRDIKIIEQGQLSPLAELRRRLGLPSAAMTPELSELSTSTGLLDKELISLASTFVPERHSFYEDPSFLIQAVRNHWRQRDARSIRLHELGPLFKDYRRIIADIHRLELTSLHSTAIISATPVHRFYHLKNANQLRMDDIPVLLTEYKQLLHLYNSNSPQL